MSKECGVHQMLFKDTFFSIPYVRCPYACCLQSDAQVDDQFHRFYSFPGKNVGSGKIDQIICSPTTSATARDDWNDGILGRSDVDVSWMERCHNNRMLTSKTHFMPIGYSPVHMRYSYSDSNRVNLFPSVPACNPFSSQDPKANDDAKQTGSLATFKHLLASNERDKKLTTIQGEEIWKNRLTFQENNHDDGNSLTSEGSSSTTETSGTKQSSNDDSAYYSGDSTGDHECNEDQSGGDCGSIGEDRSVGDYRSGGEDCSGGEYHSGGDYRSGGEDQCRMPGQLQNNISAELSVVSMTTIQRDATMKKNDNAYCPMCFKKLKNLYYLRRHMITHSAVKPFKCHFCPRRFTQTGNRNAHMRIHTGEKPFQCNVCLKSFTHASSKRRHAKVCRAYPHVTMRLLE